MIPENSSVIGIVARLDPVKGHRYFIEALPDIVKKFPDVHCLFIGDGDYREQLEKFNQQPSAPRAKAERAL